MSYKQKYEEASQYIKNLEDGAENLSKNK